MDSQNDHSHLAMQTLKDIPSPQPGAPAITALVKTGGRITGYRLSDGQTVDKQQGVELARRGGIQGVGIGVRNGREYLKSLPDGSENNNLGNLPSVTRQPASNRRPSEINSL